MRKGNQSSEKSDPVLAAIIEKIGPCRMQFGDLRFHSLLKRSLSALNGKAA